MAPQPNTVEAGYVPLGPLPSSVSPGSGRWSAWQPGPVVRMGGVDPITGQVQQIGRWRDTWGAGTSIMNLESRHTVVTEGFWEAGTHYASALIPAAEGLGNVLPGTTGFGGTVGLHAETSWHRTLQNGLPFESAKRTSYHAIYHAPVIGFDPKLIERSYTLWPTPNDLGLIPERYRDPGLWEWEKHDDGYPAFAEMVDETARLSIVANLDPGDGNGVRGQTYEPGNGFDFTIWLGHVPPDSPAPISWGDGQLHYFETGFYAYNRQRSYKYGDTETFPQMSPPSWGRPVTASWSTMLASVPHAATYDGRSVIFGRGDFHIPTGKLLFTLSYASFEQGNTEPWIPNTPDGRLVSSRDLGSAAAVEAEYRLPRWRYWIPGIPPLRQYQRNDGLTDGARRAFSRNQPTSLQGSTRQMHGRNTYL